MHPLGFLFSRRLAPPSLFSLVWPPPSLPPPPSTPPPLSVVVGGSKIAPHPRSNFESTAHEVSPNQLTRCALLSPPPPLPNSFDFLQSQPQSRQTSKQDQELTMGFGSPVWPLAVALMAMARPLHALCNCHGELRPYILGERRRHGHVDAWSTW